jgi:hypothetical protein
MNPPFVSSRYGNRLFGSLPEVRDKLQKELKARVRSEGVSATAGLGAVFVPLADKRLAEGGRLAFVLPIALATGEAWAHVRKIISDKYFLEAVVTSHDAQRTNFSENTDLSEILFIARKRKKDEKGKRALTVYIALKRNPTTIHEALDAASRMAPHLGKLLKTKGQVIVKRGDTTLAAMSSLPEPEDGGNWTSAVFSQPYLAEVQHVLSHQSALRLPGKPSLHTFPTCRLDDLGTLGYDVRDITDAFEVERGTDNWTPYPGFWDHDASKVTQIVQQPNAYLTPRTEAIAGRKLKSHEAVWGKAGKLLLVSRLWPITHKVLCVSFKEAVLGNTWWAFNDSLKNEGQRDALRLWLNSTFGMLMYFGSRAITRSAWMQMKKPAWEGLSVLDVRKLNTSQLKELSAAYRKFGKEQLLPLAQLRDDPVRKKIDDSICDVLGFPDISSLRELLSREPGLTGQAHVSTADDDEE